MAKGGSKPGERRGGRALGVPNKRTAGALAAVAALDIPFPAHGRRTGPERLFQFLEKAAKAVEYYEPPMKPNDPPNEHANWELYGFWLKIAGTFAKDLSPYQAPTFRAIMVSSTVPNDIGEPAKHPSAEIVPLNDAVGASRVYRRIVAAGGER